MLVAESAGGLVKINPLCPVDFFTRNPDRASYRFHQEVVHSLRSEPPLLPRSIAVTQGRELPDDAAIKPGFFSYLAQCGFFNGLARFQLAFRKRPVVIAWPMHEQNPRSTGLLINHYPTSSQYLGVHSFQH